MQLNYKRKLQVDQVVVVKTGSTYARLARSYKLCSWKKMQTLATA